MEIKKLVEAITQYLVKYCAEKFSGQISFSLNFNQGGITKCSVEIKENISV